MHESPNDSLIPIMLLPVAFTNLALLLYFIGRFFIPKSKFSRWQRVLGVLGLALIAFSLPGLQFWYSVIRQYDLYLLFCLPALLVLNILFSIWHKK